LNKAQTLEEVGTGKDTLHPGSRRRMLKYDGLGRLRAQIGTNTAETFTYDGSFLTRNSRVIGSDTVDQAFTYDGPGKRLNQETTDGVISGLW